MTPGIVWIASYPRSGSTWCRAFLSNLLADAPEPVSIDRLVVPSAADREWIDARAGIETSRLTPAESDQVRAAVYRSLVPPGGERVYLKVHDAFRRIEDDGWLVPPEASERAVYLVRHPLDVAVSLARLSGREPHEVVTLMNGDARASEAAHTGTLEPTQAAAPGASHVGTPQRAQTRAGEAAEAGAGRQMLQALGSWSAHVASWIDQRLFPVLVVQYEEMQRNPVEAFGRVARFLDLPCDSGRLEKAVSFSRFEELKRQEEAGGFRERPASTAAFFRRGVAGGWIGSLGADLVASLLAERQPMMRRLGYHGGGAEDRER